MAGQVWSLAEVGIRLCYLVIHLDYRDKTIGVFAPYTSIPTNLLFFDRSQPTTDIWFNEHVLPEGEKNYTKTRPMQFEEFQPILDWWDDRVENERAWKVRAADLIQTNGGGDVVSVNLDIKNPSRKEDLEHLPPAKLAESILFKENQIAAIMKEIKGLLENREWFCACVIIVFGGCHDS